MTNPTAEQASTPKYDHDCERCVFLGRTSDGYADMYFCNQGHGEKTLVARYGSLDHQYASGLHFASLNPWIGEAKAAADRRGLL